MTEVEFKGGSIPPGEFANFPVTMSIPDAAKSSDVLSFPTLQTYSDGKVVRWIEGPKAEKPSPTIDITPAGGPLLDVTGGDAGPPAKLPDGLAGNTATPQAAAAPAPAATRVIEKQQSKGLVIAALIVGALGLAAGGAALLTRRRTAG